MSQPFDYNRYEFPKDLLNSIDCVNGFQQSLFPTPVFQYELKDTSICKKISNLVKKNISNHEKKWEEYRQIDCHNTLTSDDDLHLNPDYGCLLEVLNPIIKTTIQVLNISANEFDITQATTGNVVSVSGGTVFENGALVSVSGTTNFTSSSFNATDGNYHLLVCNGGTLAIRKFSTSTIDRVPEFNAGDVIIAVIKYTSDGFGSMEVQYLTTSKAENELSIGRDNSGYTEGLTIKNNAGDVEIEAKEQDKDIIFKANDGGTPTEVMRIDGSESRVGIGTDSPTKKMEVKGDVHLSRSVDSGQTRVLSLEGARNATGNDYARIDFQNYDSDGPTSYTGARISVKNEADGVNDGSMLFYTNNAAASLTERMRITDSGNVGIGKTNPSATLDVTGNIEASTTINSGTSMTAGTSVTATTVVTGTTQVKSSGLFAITPECLDVTTAPVMSGLQSVVYVKDISIAPTPNQVDLPSASTVAQNIFTFRNLGPNPIQITTTLGEPIDDGLLDHAYVNAPNVIDLAVGQHITIQAITDSVPPLTTGWYIIGN